MTIIASYYDDFFKLFSLPESLGRQQKIIELIKEDLHTYFLNDSRLFFNHLCFNGCFDIIKECPSIIPNFSLFNYNKPANDLSNSSFFNAVKSGNLDLVKYFINSSDFHLFLQHPTFDEELGISLKTHYSKLSVISYEKFINNFIELSQFLITNFPNAIRYILLEVAFINYNDKLTNFIVSSINNLSLKPEFFSFIDDDSPLSSDNISDIYTTLFMGNLIKNSYDFCSFLTNYFSPEKLIPQRVVATLYSSSDPIKSTQWLLDNSSFLKLESYYFDNAFEQLFISMSTSLYLSSDFDYFNYLLDKKLLVFSEKEFCSAIEHDMYPLVSKLYKKFNICNIMIPSHINNKSSRFINKKIIKANFNSLQKNLSSKLNKKTKKTTKI